MRFAIMCEVLLWTGEWFVLCTGSVEFLRGSVEFVKGFGFCN